MNQKMKQLQEKINRIVHNIFQDIKKNYPIAIMIGVYFIVMTVFFHTVCPIKRMTGIPCPGCGLTRASLSLLVGNVTAAIHYNATVFLWLGGICAALIQRYVLEKKSRWMNRYWIGSFVLTMIYYIARLIHYGFANFPV